MQTLYGIHINNVGMVSVDVFSPKHTGVGKWRVYFSVRPLTVQRLRRIYRANPKAFYVNEEWSTGRWKAYKTWAFKDPAPTLGCTGGGSLDYLETSGPRNALL